jgi:tetratricopeptide (TPR) repeat protein
MNGPCGNGPVAVLEHGFSDQLAFNDLPTVQGWPAFADLLAAWDWTLGGKAEPADAELGARLLMRTRPAWEGRSGAASCVLDHLMRALELPGVLPASLFAHLTLLAGNLHYRLGDPAEARRLIERALDRLPDGSRARVAARSDLALIASGQAAFDAARIIRGSAEAARGTGDRQMIAVSLAKAAHMMASLGRVSEALNLLDEAGAAVGDDRALRRHYLARRSFVLLRAGLVTQAHDDAQQVLADLGKATSYERVLTLLVHGWAQACGDPGAAHRTLNEGLSLARHRQVLVLAPDLTLALAYARRGIGQFDEAIRLTSDALRLSLSQHDLLTGIGALHLAMALADDTANADAARIAAAVRECRLCSGVSAWPLTECECARYEKALGVDSVPASSGALEPSLFNATAELVLTHLSARRAAPAC